MPMNCLSVFDHFAELALKGFKKKQLFIKQDYKKITQVVVSQLGYMAIPKFISLNLKQIPSALLFLPLMQIVKTCKKLKNLDIN